MAPRPGKEGIVVRFVHTDDRVKLKQEDYIELHRIATGLNEKSVYERAMRAWLDNPVGTDRLEVVLGGVPDELHEWVTERAVSYFIEFHKIRAEVRDAWTKIHEDMNFNFTRRQFASEANGYPKIVRKALFLHLDGMDSSQLIWKHLRPKGQDNVVTPSREVSNG